MEVGKVLKGILAAGLIAGLGAFGSSCTKSYNVPPASPKPISGTPTQTPTQTDTSVYTQTPTPSYTNTHTFSPTSTHTLTTTDVPTETPTPTPSKTSTFTETATSTNTCTPTETATPTSTPTFTFTPTPHRKYGSSHSTTGATLTDTVSVAAANDKIGILEPTRWLRADMTYAAEDSCSPITSGKDIAAFGTEFYELDAGSVPPHVWVRPNNSCSVNYVLDGGSALTSSSTGLAVASDGSAWIADGNRLKQISLTNVLLNNIDLGANISAITAGNSSIYSALSNGNVISMNEDGTNPITFTSPVTGIVDMTFNSNLNVLEALLSDRAYVINPTTITILPGGEYGLGNITGGRGIWVDDDVSYIVDSSNQVKEFPRWP